MCRSMSKVSSVVLLLCLFSRIMMVSFPVGPVTYLVLDPRTFILSSIGSIPEEALNSIFKKWLVTPLTFIIL